MKLRWLGLGLGAALLLLLPYFYSLVLPSHSALYHHRLPIPHLAGGLLLDLALVLILSIGIIIGVKLLPCAMQRTVSACLAGLVIWRAASDSIVIISSWRAIVAPEVPQRFALYWGRLSHPLAAGTILLLAILGWARPKVTQPLVRATCVGLMSFAFCTLWLVPQLIHLSFSKPSAPVQSLRHPQPLNNQRIVWILFDELSYDLVFDHTLAGQEFANFNKLRSQSTSFSKLSPIGLFTDRIVLSLFAGRPINVLRSTLDGRVSYRDESAHRWLAYDPESSLFGLAHANGWNSGVAGWYNPYCRIFGPVLDTCSWRPGIHALLPIEEMGASEDNSALTNALVVPRALLSPSRLRESRKTTLLRRNILDYREVMRRAKQLIGDREIDFVFLHLPVPHPPGIYDRKNHVVTEGGTYLDNLVLADDTLGVLMQEIDSTSRAGHTTIIVSSDHSWRTSMWNQGGDWSDEEERISGGRFDQRPVLLIHFPGQNSSNEITSSESELLEHDIVKDIIQNRISTAEQLSGVVSEHDSEAATTSRAEGDQTGR